jgi:hypothetical protein
MGKSEASLLGLIEEFLLASHDLADALVKPAPLPFYDTLSRPVPLATVPDEGRKRESVDEVKMRLHRIALKLSERTNRGDVCDGHFMRRIADAVRAQTASAPRIVRRRRVKR